MFPIRQVDSSKIIVLSNLQQFQIVFLVLGKALGQENTAILKWIPGHSDIEVNEKMRYDETINTHVSLISS